MTPKPKPSASVLTLYPAYNQSYPNCTLAKADFLRGHTFITKDGTHTSIRDVSTTQTIRIKLHNTSIVFTLATQTNKPV